MFNNILRICFVFTLAITNLNCSASNSSAPEFDAERAFSHLIKQTDFGPRVPGSEAWRQCRSYFYGQFSEFGIKVDSQVSEFTDPYSGSVIPMVNVIAHIKGIDSTSKGILFMAHYDSRPRTDFPTDPNKAASPIVGANDGASGVAVLLELSKLFSEVRPPRNIDIVFVDAEDWGKEGDNDYYLLGSKEFARRGIRDKYNFGIVIDMIGDSSQQIYLEQFSEHFHPKLNDMVWNTAQELGINTFVDSVKFIVLDDHISLATSGIPAIVLIDFDYEHWHTEFDTPDKCSPQSLANVGNVLKQIAYNPSLWPTK